MAAEVHGKSLRQKPYDLIQENYHWQENQTNAVPRIIPTAMVNKPRGSAGPNHCESRP
jgi:hypothetical protein